MKKPLVGLLPLYVELYDLTNPEIRPNIDTYHETTLKKLEERGLDVIDVPVCRLKKEFEEAIDKFDKADVDAIVTLHLAYSPSLESEHALSQVKVPIIVLDSTPAYIYDQTTDPGQLMLNHGIHGVQDMCNLLVRNKKHFHVYAGHLDYSNVLDRVYQAARAAMMVHALQNSRVGIVGKPFQGMGDFQLDVSEFKRDLGIQTIYYDFEKAGEFIDKITERELQNEFKLDQKLFEIDPKLSKEVYERSAKTAFVVRKWIEKEHLSAFTINFLETEGSRPGLPVMPFTECSKAMARGIGYAGEGDILTASFTGALLSGCKEVTFTEMFCPNWRDGSVFLSHMGEFNYAVASGPPILKELPFPYTNAENPIVAYQTLKPGSAVFVNLAPLGQGHYRLTAAKGEMLKIEGRNTMDHSINGWFKPDISLETFLEKFSEGGGTHHSVLVYGEDIETFSLMADFLGFEKTIL